MRGGPIRLNRSSEGAQFRRRVAALGFEEILTVPRSPWQSPRSKRLIGTVRRECLDNVVVLGERHLLLGDDLRHYRRWRCHQGLDMQCPEPRRVQPPEQGRVVEVAESGGMHRQYERLAA